MHRFRDVARQHAGRAPDDDRAILEAYTEGVNAGLASLAKKPFEYLLLAVEPAPWQPEDSALVMFSMYLDLQGEDAEDESTLGVLHDLLPEPMFDFLAPRGTEWDAPDPGRGVCRAAHAVGRRLRFAETAAIDRRSPGFGRRASRPP